MEDSRAYSHRARTPREPIQRVFSVRRHVGPDAALLPPRGVDNDDRAFAGTFAVTRVGIADDSAPTGVRSPMAPSEWICGTG
jgi:hypothetical protein